MQASMRRIPGNNRSRIESTTSAREPNERIRHLLKEPCISSRYERVGGAGPGCIFANQQSTASLHEVDDGLSSEVPESWFRVLIMDTKAPPPPTCFVVEKNSSSQKFEDVTGTASAAESAEQQSTEVEMTHSAGVLWHLKDPAPSSTR